MTSHFIEPSIFRAYDIRGIVDQDLTPEAVFLIGQAFGSESLDQQEHIVIVARDGRLSSPVLSQALQEGLLSSGCDVIDIGAVPTPLLYFATHQLESKSGIMLTGSHNPPNYNGLKLVLSGKTLEEKGIKNLYQRIIRQRLSKGRGSYQTKNIVEQYIQIICNQISLNKPLKVVIDCGNGIAGVVAPSLMKRLGCEVIELYCDVNGNFPNHHPDPSQLDTLTDLITQTKNIRADIGIAFDGDGDRLGIVTNRGNNIFPDQLMMLFTIDVLAKCPYSNIIYDVKCSKNLGDIITQHHGNPIMSRTGHSFIKEQIKEKNAVLAGEMSGHIFFNDRWYGFDDAIYSAARLLEILSHTNQDIDTIFDQFPKSISTPELKITIEDSKKFAFAEAFQNKTTFKHAKKITIDGLRVEFSDGWGLLRASNTTPCLVLRFEADNKKALSRIQRLFRQEILKLDPSLQVP